MKSKRAAIQLLAILATISSLSFVLYPSSTRIFLANLVSDENGLDSDWSIPYGDHSSNLTLISAWANRHYSQGGVYGFLDEDVKSVSSPNLPLEVSKLMWLEVLDIRDQSYMVSFKSRDSLHMAGLAVLNDSSERAYTISLEIYNSSKDRISISSVGPAIDRRFSERERPLRERHLSSYPANHVMEQLDHRDTRFISVLGPKLVRQDYIQIGQDIKSAKFINLDTGGEATGISELRAIEYEQFENLN